jgi:hypothetical protein
MNKKLIEKGNRTIELIKEGKIKHPAINELLIEIDNTIKKYELHISDLEVDNLQKDIIIHSEIIRPSKIKLDSITANKLNQFASYFIQASEMKLKIQLNEQLIKLPKEEYYKQWLNNKLNVKLK